MRGGIQLYRPFVIQLRIIVSSAIFTALLLMSTGCVHAPAHNEKADETLSSAEGANVSDTAKKVIPKGCDESVSQSADVYHQALQYLMSPGHVEEGRICMSIAADLGHTQAGQLLAEAYLSSSNEGADRSEAERLMRVLRKKAVETEDCELIRWVCQFQVELERAAEGSKSDPPH